MSRLYTKTGDKGFTTLYDMRRVPKKDDVFMILGSLDELSAYIGLLCSCELTQSDISILRGIQNHLLNIGSNFATTTKRDKIVKMSKENVAEMEALIDTYDSKSTKLTEFILPGSNRNDSVAHICRSICRRAELYMWRIHDDDFYVEQETFHYVNRLSDFFFAFARYLSNGKEIRRSQF